MTSLVGFSQLKDTSIKASARNVELNLVSSTNAANVAKCSKTISHCQSVFVAYDSWKKKKKKRRRSWQMALRNRKESELLGCFVPDASDKQRMRCGDCS